MRSHVALLASCVAALAFGCGSRTPLERNLGELMPGDASDDARSDADEGGEDGGLVFCEPLVGPVPARDVPEGSDFPQCTETFPHCVEVGGEWACCDGPGPYNGPGGSCIF